MKKFKNIFKYFFKPYFNLSDYINFEEACKNGEINVMKKLLDSKKIKEYPFSISSLFSNVCLNGHFSVIQYLLTSSNTQDFHDIHIKSNEWINSALKSGNTEILKYLYSSPEILKLPNSSKDLVFKVACKNNLTNIIEFMIIDLNIVKTDEIKKYLEHEEDFVNRLMRIKKNKRFIPFVYQCPNIETIQYVNKIFDVRDLSNELNQQFTPKTKKMKL